MPFFADDLSKTKLVPNLNDKSTVQAFLGPWPTWCLPGTLPASMPTGAMSSGLETNAGVGVELGAFTDIQPERPLNSFVQRQRQQAHDQQISPGQQVGPFGTAVVQAQDTEQTPVAANSSEVSLWSSSSNLNGETSVGGTGRRAKTRGRPRSSAGRTGSPRGSLEDLEASELKRQERNAREQRR